MNYYKFNSISIQFIIYRGSDSMIRVIYRNERLWKAPHALWTIIAFLINTLFVWYIVLKCCFQELAMRPPIPLSVIFLIYTLLDRLYPFFKNKKFISFRFFIDMIVWTLLTLSFYLPNQNVVCFLGLPVVIYLYDVVYLKDFLFDMVRRYYWIYKIYIIFKIMYWIILYGHIIGCIFYAIEMNLINNQTFGPYALNPLNYYQGQLLAYTPIMMFQDLNRYVYAMYFSFALVSTIAFGDIIGKNYIQDIYVTILIVLSTVVIALVVEQMYMIFRRKKTRFFQLLNKIRFLSERLKGYKQIPSNFRMEIINFLTELSWKHLNEQPAELQTAVQFKTKLMRQSVIFNPELPLFYAKYVLHKLKLAHLPKGILVYNNLPQKQQLTSYLVTKGKFWVGYSTLKGRLTGGYTLQQQGMNFGIQQAFAGTNDLYRYLQVRTVTSGSVLTINAKQLRETILELQDIDFPYEKPIEHFQNAKERAMLKNNKYMCSICQAFDHTLIDCPTCHYVVTHQMKIEITKKLHERALKNRKKIKSHKIRNMHLQTISEKPGKSWRLMQIEKYREIFNRIKLMEDQNEMLFEKWYEWTVYGTWPTEELDKQNQSLGRNTNLSSTLRRYKIN